MPQTKHNCPNCSAPVLKIRWDAGYHYCMSRECFLALGKNVPLFEAIPKTSESDLNPGEVDTINESYYDE